MAVTEDQNLRQEHDKSHEATLVVLKETDEVLLSAQKTISEARARLQKATEKYQERLNGPKYTSPN